MFGDRVDDTDPKISVRMILESACHTTFSSRVPPRLHLLRDGAGHGSLGGGGEGSVFHVKRNDAKVTNRDIDSRDVRIEKGGAPEVNPGAPPRWCVCGSVLDDDHAT